MRREMVLLAALLGMSACGPTLTHGPARARSPRDVTAETPLVAEGVGIAIATAELKARLDEQDPPTRQTFGSPEAKRQFLSNMIRFYALARAAEKEGFGNRPEVQLALKKLIVSSYHKQFFPSLGASHMSVADARKYYQATERRKKEFEALAERLVADAHVRVDEAELDRVAVAAPRREEGPAGGESSRTTERDAKAPLVAEGSGIAITTRELKARLDEQDPRTRQTFGTPEAKRRLLNNMIRFHALAQAAEKEGFGDRSEVQFALKKVMVASYYKQFFESQAVRGLTTEDRKKEFDLLVERLVASAHVRIDETQLERVVVADPAMPAGDEIVIGLVVPLSGGEAAFGQSVLQGVKLALDEQNRRGPVQGKRLVLKTADSRGQPEEAAAVLRQMLLHDGPVAVIGEVASSRSIAMAPLADKYRVSVISPTATNPHLTQVDGHTRPYVFRACFIDPYQGTAMARFARRRLKVKRAAIVRDLGNEYSLALAERFSDEFKRLGGEIVAERSYRASDQDFRSQLGGIKGERPEAIYVPGLYTDVALIGRQARDLGIRQPLLGGDGWDSRTLLEQAKGALDGSYFTNHFAAEDPAAGVQAFVKKHRDAYHATPDALSALGYDAGRLVLQALERAPEPTASGVRGALEQGRPYKVISGSMVLDARHDGVRSAVVFRVVRSMFSYLATVNP